MTSLFLFQGMMTSPTPLTLPCPAEGWHLNYYKSGDCGLATTYRHKTWQACAGYCHGNEGCVYWTFVPSPALGKYQCVLWSCFTDMRNYPATSGSRNCTGAV